MVSGQNIQLFETEREGEVRLEIIDCTSEPLVIIPRTDGMVNSLSSWTWTVQFGVILRFGFSEFPKTILG